MSQNILVIGGSRNIGYFSALRFLAAGASVVFLLRSPSVFDNDTAIQDYIKSGKVRLVKGDALVRDDVKRAWDEAGKGGFIDLLLFTVGGIPKIHPLRGAVITPENLVTQSLLNVLTTLPSPQTKIITLSSTGLTHATHGTLPFALRPLYAFLLSIPHRDKLGAERAIAYCAGWDWDPKDDKELGDDLMGTDWKNREGLPAPGSLKQALVIRPAVLTDGPCVADKESKNGRVKSPYRVGENVGGWTVSRQDVAHFVADAYLNRWDEFVNRRISIVY